MANGLRFVVFALLSAEAVGRAQSAAAISSQGNEGYTTNAICQQNNCVNPILPASADLMQLNSTTWQCQDAYVVKKYMSFCKNALYYNPGVPSPTKEMSMEQVVAAQDDAASTQYFYALNGMNVEPWAHRQPWLEQDKCTTSIWKAVCGTYFPRAEAGCQLGTATKYLRPCKNVCENYLSSCAVECCDESVKCVYSNTVSLLDGKSAVEEGYANEDGPSAMCTGAAAPNALGFGGAVLLFLMTLLACR